MTQGSRCSGSESGITGCFKFYMNLMIPASQLLQCDWPDGREVRSKLCNMRKQSRTATAVASAHSQVRGPTDWPLRSEGQRTHTHTHTQESTHSKACYSIAARLSVRIQNLKVQIFPLSPIIIMSNWAAAKTAQAQSDLKNS